MSDLTSLEDRIAALEAELDEVKRQLTQRNANGNWVEELSGSMKQFPEFSDVVRFGKELRKSS